MLKKKDNPQILKIWVLIMIVSLIGVIFGRMEIKIAILLIWIAIILISIKVQGVRYEHP